MDVAEGTEEPNPPRVDSGQLAESSSRLDRLRDALPDVIADLLPDREVPEPKAPWLSDAPPDLSKVKDAFGVEEIIDGLVETVAAARPPFTLSLSGSWGIGKSTVAEAIVSRLRAKGKAAVLIDAWTEDVSTLRRSLIVSVGAAMAAKGDERKEAEQRETIAKLLDDAALTSTTSNEKPEGKLDLWASLRGMWANPIATIVIFGMIGLLLWGMAIVDPASPWAGVLPPIFGVLIGFLLVQSGFLFYVKQTSSTRGPAEQSVIQSREFRKYVTGSGVSNPPKRVLVVVDNLDRLPGEDAVKALAEIRSLVEIKGSRCVFLIPVDRAALVGHITGALDGNGPESSGGTADAAKSSANGKAKAARDYLDKFFNLDLLLTQPETIDIRGWALEQALEVLPNDDPEDLTLAVQMIAFVGGDSPRTVKRIINGVSSRHRLLARGTRPRLSQLAFVESLLSLAPSLLNTLAEEPRHLVNARLELAQEADGEKQREIVSTFSSKAHVDQNVVPFLLSYSDIELSVPQLRLILSLREDREWRGVSDPTLLRPALWAGDAEGFAAALAATPEEERVAALERSMDRIDRSGVAFSRDALDAITAIYGSVEPYPAMLERLYRKAMTVLAGSPPQTVRRITPGLADFLFAQGRADRRREELATLISDGLALAKGEQAVTADHVRVVRRSAPDLPAEAHQQVRQLLAGLPDDVLEPLFDPDADVKLVDGPVAQSYIATVASVDFSETVFTDQLDAIERVKAFTEAGGAHDPSEAAVAASITKGLGAHPELPAPVTPVVEGAVDLLTGFEGVEVDELATTLSNRSDWDRGFYFDLALRLTSSDSVEKAIVAAFDAWLAGSKPIESGSVQKVLANHVVTLTTWNSAWNSLVLDQWVKRDDAGFARLVIEFLGETGVQEIIARLVAAPPDEVPALSDSAISILANRPDGVGRVILALADWVMTAIPISSIAELVQPLLRIEALGLNTGPVAAAIGERAKALSTPADLAALVAAAATLDSGGVQSAKWSADALAERGSARSLIGVGPALWLAQHATDKALVATMIADTIESDSTPTSAAVDLARSTRKLVDRKAEVAYALVHRADHPNGTVDVARAMLTEALLWRPQPATSKAAYEAYLSSISGRWSELDPLINELKGVGKRKKSQQDPT